MTFGSEILEFNNENMMLFYRQDAICFVRDTDSAGIKGAIHLNTLPIRCYHRDGIESISNAMLLVSRLFNIFRDLKYIAFITGKFDSSISLQPNDPMPTTLGKLINELYKRNIQRSTNVDFMLTFSDCIIVAAKSIGYFRNRIRDSDK